MNVEWYEWNGPWEQFQGTWYELLLVVPLDEGDPTKLESSVRLEAEQFAEAHGFKELPEFGLVCVNKNFDPADYCGATDPLSDF